MKVRREIAIRIGLQRRKRLDRFVQRCRRRAFQRPEEKPHVGAETVDLFVGRHDDNAQRVLPIARLNRDVERLGRRRQSPHVRGRLVHAGASRSGFQKRLEVEGRRRWHRYMAATGL